MDDPQVGTKINRYEILDCLHKTELLGLYKVFDTKLERNVLMKLVFHSPNYSKEFIQYFLGESRSLAKMSHPNIARVLDFGYDGTNLYLISEYRSQQTLAEIMTAPMAWQRAVELLIPVTEALSYAHSQGVIHRDLQPDNISLTDDDRPILSDFSLIRMIESEETRDMTGTNVGLGSPAYISPEQGKGITVDFRSDIYSLGIIFFEMITGCKPFSADTSMEIVIQHVTMPPPKPRSIIPDLPGFVEEIVLKSISKDVDKRYQTMEEFSQALRSALLAPDQGSKRSPVMNSRWVVGISAAALILVILSGLFAWRYSQQSLPTASPNSTEIPALETQPEPSATEEAVDGGPPTEEPIAASPSPPATETNSFPEAAFALPAIPVLAQTPVPASDELIDKNNAGSLSELARWGTPDFFQFAFIENNQVLLSATSAGMYYFDAATLTPRYFFDAKGSISTFAVSADGEWVATGDTLGDIYVWSIKDGSEIAHFEGDSKPIKALDFSPDKSMLVSSAIGKTAHLWDLKQKSELFALQGHGLNISKVLFSPEGDTVISGGEDFKILIWDVASGEILKKYTAAKKINDMSLSSDGKTLALGLNNATIEIWDLDSGLLINTISDPEVVEPYSFIRFLPNDQLILSGSEDGVVRVWNTQASDMLWATTHTDANGIPVRPARVKSLAMSNNGTKFIVLFEDELAELWNLSNQKLERSVAFNYEPIQRVAISPDGRTVAYQSGTSFVDIWSFPGATPRAQIDGTLPRGNIFSEDSQNLLIQTSDLLLYALSNTQPQLLFTYHGFPPNGSVTYLQSGKMVAASSSGVVKYWSTSSGQELQPGALKNESNCRVIYGRNGGFLVAGSINGIIGTDINLLYFCQVSRGARTTSESFLPDGSIVALSQENQAVDIWNLHSGNQKTTLRSESPGDMLSVAISNDGSLLAAASASGMIEIYDLATMQLVSRLDLHTGPVSQVLFSHDGKYIIAGSTDGTIRFFGLNP